MNPPCRAAVGAFMLVTLMVTPAPAGADALEGSWRLTSYEGGASVGRSSGLMVLADGHFSFVYTMEEAGGRRWGRAHAGPYSLQGDSLVLRVEWSLEYVSGKPSVAEEPVERTTRFKVAGDSLTIMFDNGAVQRFERARGGR